MTKVESTRVVIEIFMEKNKPIKCFGIPDGVEIIVWDTDAALIKGKGFQSVCKGDEITHKEVRNGQAKTKG